MLIAILVGVLTLMVTHDLVLSIRVFLAAALVAVVVFLVAIARSFRRRSMPEPRARSFWWAPWALGDFAVSALLFLGAYFWLEEQARAPALAKGMWWNRDCCNVESAYDERLRQRFLGHSEGLLREELAKQDFEFRGSRSARASWWDVACSHFATAEWEADAAGQVTAIRGDVGSSCL